MSGRIPVSRDKWVEPAERPRTSFHYISAATPGATATNDEVNPIAHCSGWFLFEILCDGEPPHDHAAVHLCLTAGPRGDGRARLL